MNKAWYAYCSTIKLGMGSPAAVPNWAWEALLQYKKWEAVHSYTIKEQGMGRLIQYYQTWHGSLAAVPNWAWEALLQYYRTWHGKPASSTIVNWAWEALWQF